MLYNCEVWNITKSELKDLEAKNVYLMRKVVGNDVRNEEESLSGSRLLERLGLESIEMMIRKKRLQWIAHCARRGERDLTWQADKGRMEKVECEIG